MFSRTYLVVAWLKVIETVLPLAGSNTRPADGDRSLNDVPLVLPCTASVWVRVPQPLAGSFSTTRLTATAEPRSTCTCSGNELLVLSQ